MDTRDIPEEVHGLHRLSSEARALELVLLQRRLQPEEQPGAGGKSERPPSPTQAQAEASTDRHSLGFHASLSRDALLMREYAYLVGGVVVLQGFTQLSGGVVLRNYAASLFLASGDSRDEAMQLTVVLGVIKLVCTLFAVAAVERVGRRFLLMLGVVLVALGMLILTVAVAGDDEVSSPSSAFIVGAGLVVGAYGIGYGPISWALSSEMFPVAIRGKVLAVALVSQNFSLLVTNLMYLKLLENVTPEGTFGLFFSFNVLCLALVYARLPETRGREPQTILTLALQYRNVPLTHCNRRAQIEGDLALSEFDALRDVSGSSKSDTENPVAAQAQAQAQAQAKAQAQAQDHEMRL